MWQVKRILIALQDELSIRSTISQAVMLLTVAEFGTITLTDLATEMQMSPSTISRLAAILGDVKFYGGKEGKNLITLSNLEFDRKQKQASLSNYGRLFIKELFALKN